MIIYALRLRRSRRRLAEIEARMCPRFDRDSASYDPAAANAFWQAYHEAQLPPLALRELVKRKARLAIYRLREIARARSLRDDQTVPF